MPTASLKLLDVTVVLYSYGYAGCILLPSVRENLEGKGHKHESCVFKKSFWTLGYFSLK